MSNSLVRVLMPQMGESINEATVSLWRKKVGDPVQEGDALLDISTTKIESEIPAPASGVVLSILVAEGATVPVDTVIAVIGPAGANAADALENPAPLRELTPTPAAPAPAAHHEPDTEAEADLDRERVRRMRRRSTPLVRNIAQDLGVNLGEIRGSGANGRVTKRDLEQHLAEQKHMEKAQGTVPSKSLPPPENRPPSKLRPGQVRLDTVAGPYEDGHDIEPEITTISAMRRQIADNLARSSATIPHAYTCHEVDFTQLEKLRVRYKPIFETQFDTRLTPLVFLVQAVADALLRFPSINATWAGDRIIRHRMVNIGIAVALREGLVVPVLRNVESMSLAGIARGLVDLGTRARHNQLRPADIDGGTFTITSPGQLGATFAIPIIMPPQGGIIHLGAIQKVPCVVTGPDGQDAIAIRQRAMMTLGIDHRLIDGWEADQFMVAIKERIERADFGLPA